MTYETSDLYFVAYAMVHGVKISKTRQTGSRVVFILEDGGKASSLYVQWINETDALPSASAYAERLKQLKRLVMANSPHRR